MKIYTRTGDQGQTSLLGGEQVSKADPRVGAFGAIDELNASLGGVRAEQVPQQFDEILLLLQNQMFELGAELASSGDSSSATEAIQPQDVEQLEKFIDSLEEKLTPLKQFILPGGTPVAASLHMARCVCRRAERELVALSQSTSIRGVLLTYVNRVSDLLFVMARAANAAEGIADVPWKKTR